MLAPQGTGLAGGRKVQQVTTSFSLFQANRQPAKLNLLTCQVKPNAEDKKSFDLISRESLFSPGQLLWVLMLPISIPKDWSVRGSWQGT